MDEPLMGEENGPEGVCDLPEVPQHLSAGEWTTSLAAGPQGLTLSAGAQSRRGSLGGREGGSRQSFLLGL